MIKLKAFDLSVSGVVWRFYLMMALAAIFGFLHQWALAAILAFIVAISFIVGISVHIVKPEKLAVSEKVSRLRSMDKKANTQKAA
jgi:hypothetical protein